MQAGRRTVPILYLLATHLAELGLRTGRQGDGLVFGRDQHTAFEPSTIRRRAVEA